MILLAEIALRPNDLWVMATGICCSMACAIVGCFLVLRRMSLLGDAISHAVLPGLAIAFIITGSRDPLPMLAGALGVGVLTALASSGLSRWGRVPEDAAMGVVFSSLFAVGVLLITWVAGSIDLDPGCVLYGLIEYVPFDTVRLGAFELPRAFVWLAIVLLLNATLITLFYKELKIVCFDPYLATTMGISAALVHYALMGVVATTTVASFEAVGSILVVAMLVAPGATAHLLTDRLSRMIWLSALLAASAAIIGYQFAVLWNTSVAGMMSVVAGAEFALALLLAPRHGLVSRAYHKLALSLRIAREDILGLLYRAEEARSGQAPITSAPAVIPPLLASLARASLVRQRFITQGPAPALTETGRASAREIIRAHRLWETFLAENTTLPPDHLHEPAERTEHYITPAIAQELTRAFDAQTDPHGKVIP